MQEADQYKDIELATHDTKPSGINVGVSRVDGKSRGVGSFDTYKLIPGERVITVSGNPQLGFYNDHTDIVFDAKPGRTYKLVYTNLGGGG